MNYINHNVNDEMLQILNGLIHNWEHEVVEFKQASNDYDKDKIGQYFLARGMPISFDSFKGFGIYQCS